MAPLSRMALAAVTWSCASEKFPRRAARRACACSQRKFHKSTRVGLMSGSFSPVQKRKTWPWPARRRIFARASRQRRWLFESICARLGLFPSNPARLRQRCWPAPKPARIRESADRAPEHLPGFLPALLTLLDELRLLALRGSLRE